MRHTPITIDMRILSREEAEDILEVGLHNYLPNDTVDAAGRVLDLLSRHYILLLRPDKGDES